MPVEKTIDQIMQKLVGEFRQTIRADLRWDEAEAERQDIIANKPSFPVVATKAQFEAIYNYNVALSTADETIRGQQSLVQRNSKKIHQWLSDNNYPTDQVFRIPFDNDTTVDVRIIVVYGNPTIDHSLDPNSELYTP